MELSIEKQQIKIIYCGYDCRMESSSSSSSSERLRIRKRNHLIKKQRIEAIRNGYVPTSKDSLFPDDSSPATEFVEQVFSIAFLFLPQHWFSMYALILRSQLVSQILSRDEPIRRSR